MTPFFHRVIVSGCVTSDDNPLCQPPRSSGSPGCQVALSESTGCAVPTRVVRNLIDPAAPDDPDPGAGEDSDRVGMVVATGSGPSVDVGGPRARMAGVVGEGRERVSE